MRVNRHFPDPVTGLDNLVWMLEQTDEIDQTEGCEAYAKYRRVMQDYANAYRVPLDRVTAAFCALSPNNDYVGNLRSLTSVLEGFVAGTPVDRVVISTYNHCRDRAFRYLNGEEDFDTPNRGLKIKSFYWNILDPDCPAHVTIDGHMAAAYAGDSALTMKEVLLSRNWYRVISGAVIDLADEVGLLPNQLQAILWFTRKRLYRIKYVPIRDMFAEPGDSWRILIPLDQLPAYPLRAIDEPAIKA